MKALIKWSHLTGTQRKQILSFFHEEIERKELFQHNLNHQRFLVDLNSGNVQFRKDF